MDAPSAAQPVSAAGLDSCWTQVVGFECMVTVAVMILNHYIITATGTLSFGVLQFLFLFHSATDSESRIPEGRRDLSVV